MGHILMLKPTYTHSLAPICAKSGGSLISHMKLSIHLVTWNGAKYIPYLFDSLRKQTFKDWQLLVVDNNSQDNTVELVKKELENFSTKSQIIENTNNLGFAGGHNQAFKESDSGYVLLLNADMCLQMDCL